MDVFFATTLTLVIIFIIPVVVYGLFSKFIGLKEPEKKPSFFLSVLVQKIGTSVGFVLLFYLGREYFKTQWLTYGLIWFAMFAVVEIGQAILPAYSKEEAAAGIISELIYFPLAALAITQLIS
jgi:hypothetical protein